MALNQNALLQILIDMKKTGTGDQQVQDGLDKTTKSAAANKDEAGKLTKAWKAVEGGLILAGLAFIKSVPAMIKQGEEINRARTALVAYTGDSDSAQAAIEGVQSALGFSITQFEAAQQASRLFAMGMVSGAEEAAEFTRVATTLGAAMGNDAQVSLENFTLLLANQSLLRLDTFGVSAAQVKIRMEELSVATGETDRSVLFMDAAMEIATAQADKLSASGFTATSNIERMGAMARQAKEDFASWLADGYVPLIDNIFRFGEELDGANTRLVEGSDTYDEYMRSIWDVNDAKTKAALFTVSLSEAEWNEQKSAQAAAAAERERAAALDESTEATVINLEALGEALITMDMVEKAVNGKLGPAYDEWLETTSTLQRENDLLAQHMLNLVNAGIDPASDSFMILTDQYNENKEKMDDAAESVKDLTTQLVFQQLSAGADAQTTLELAGALGILDQRTLDTLQAAQTLKDQWDAQDGVLDGVISDTEGYAEAARILRDELAGIPAEVVTTIHVNQIGVVEGGLSNMPGFQHGGRAVVGGSPGTDRVPVSMMLDRGEGIEITPAREMQTGPSGDSFAPVGATGGSNGTGGVTIGTVVIQNGMDWAAFEERIRRATR